MTDEKPKVRTVRPRGRPPRDPATIKTPKAPNPSRYGVLRVPKRTPAHQAVFNRYTQNPELVMASIWDTLSWSALRAAEKQRGEMKKKTSQNRANYKSALDKYNQQVRRAEYAKDKWKSYHASIKEEDADAYRKLRNKTKLESKHRRIAGMRAANDSSSASSIAKRDRELEPSGDLFKAPNYWMVGKQKVFGTATPATRSSARPGFLGKHESNINTSDFSPAGYDPHYRGRSDPNRAVDVSSWQILAGEFKLAGKQIPGIMKYWVDYQAKRVVDELRKASPGRMAGMWHQSSQFGDESKGNIFYSIYNTHIAFKFNLRGTATHRIVSKAEGVTGREPYGILPRALSKNPNKPVSRKIIDEIRNSRSSDDEEDVYNAQWLAWKELVQDAGFVDEYAPRLKFSGTWVNHPRKKGAFLLSRGHMSKGIYEHGPKYAMENMTSWQRRKAFGSWSITHRHSAAKLRGDVGRYKSVPSQEKIDQIKKERDSWVGKWADRGGDYAPYVLNHPGIKANKKLLDTWVRLSHGGGAFREHKGVIASQVAKSIMRNIQKSSKAALQPGKGDSFATIYIPIPTDILRK